MTIDERVARHRISVLQYARNSKNITKTCKIFGISRTVYYRWLKRFEKFGRIGLLDIEPAKPVMPNKTKPDKENIILSYIVNYPSHGPKRIANELSAKGVMISDTGVYNVLKRNGLNKKIDRLFHMEKMLGHPVITENIIREASKSKHIDADYPGCLFAQDTFYVGTLKGVGRIYQQTGVDCYSSFGFAKLYCDKTANSAIDFLDSSVLPIYKLFGIPLDRILTDNGKEYTTHWKKGKHPYQEHLETLSIKQTRIRPRTPRTNGFVERLNRTILEEFYELAFRKKIYNNIGELQTDLNKFLHYYNFKRTHQGYRLNGKTPSEKFLDCKRKLCLPAPN